MADGKTSETPRGLGDFIFTMEKTKEQQLKEAYADLEKADADYKKAKADMEKAYAGWWKARKLIEELEKQQ